MDKALLRTYGNEDLARLLLRILWQGYDADGISYGRSLRAFLLESARHYLPEVKLDFGPEDHSAVIDEAELRVRTKEPVQLLLYPGRGPIEGFMDCQFLQLLLMEIKRWYRQQRAVDFYRRDLRVLELALSLVPHNLRLNKYSLHVVVAEARERNWILSKRALAVWDEERRRRDEEILRAINE
ncbi:MAG: hypothetical protein ACM3NH_01450 [Candidatus Saccharibacteria bacterium]